MPSQNLKYHADYLRAFWKDYGFRRQVSSQEWQDTIAALQRAGEIKIAYSKKVKDTPAKRRVQFDEVKNQRMRYKFLPGDKCFACGLQPDVRHHIIWLKNGGRNNRRNMCFLCNDCHAEVHPWLKNK